MRRVQLQALVDALKAVILRRPVVGFTPNFSAPPSTELLISWRELSGIQNRCEWNLPVVRAVLIALRQASAPRLSQARVSPLCDWLLLAASVSTRPGQAEVSRRQPFDRWDGPRSGTPLLT